MNNRRKTILFYNELHNGDIHMSRPYVVDLMSILGDNDYYYLHKNNSRLLADIKGLKTISSEEELPKCDLKISTWIGQFSWNSNGEMIAPFYGCNFTNYYSVMTKVYQSIGVLKQMKPIDFYCPQIDYNQFKIEGIDNYFSNKKRKHVLICNNHVNSGQAYGSMTQLIQHLSNKFSDYIFVVSNKLSDEDKISSENVVYASDIINDPTILFDMNEVSYIAKNCDVIIGRSSGPYTFSITKDTISSKVFVCFCNSVQDSWPTDRTIWSNNYNNMNEICEQVLQVL